MKSIYLPPNFYFTVFTNLQKKAKGSHLLEQVFQHLELVEKDYFGLQFTENGSPPSATNTEITVSKIF